MSARASVALAALTVELAVAGAAETGAMSIESADAGSSSCAALALQRSSFWPSEWSLEVSQWVREPLTCALVSDPLGKAHEALRRAQVQWQQQRTAEFELLEGLAREWRSVAQDLVRASRVEAEAAELEEQWVQVETELARVHASMEQVRAQLSRLEAAMVGEATESAEGS